MLYTLLGCSERQITLYFHISPIHLAQISPASYYSFPSYDRVRFWELACLVPIVLLAPKLSVETTKTNLVISMEKTNKMKYLPPWLTIIKYNQFFILLDCQLSFSLSCIFIFRYSYIMSVPARKIDNKYMYSYYVMCCPQGDLKTFIAGCPSGC